MFGMGMSEILLILALALIVIGPKKLPDLARVIGRGLGEFRRATDDIQRTIYQEAHKPLNPKEFLKDLDTVGAQVKPGPPPGSAAAEPHPETPPEPPAQEPPEGPPEAPPADRAG